MSTGTWVARLGSFPGREGEDLGLWLEEGEPPRVVRLVWLPGASEESTLRLTRDVAHAAEALHHPHIQAPVGVESIDGSLALVMENADGETLREILAVGGRLPPAIAARLVRDACDALHFAHEEGQEGGPIVHGWLQPDCLLVSRSGVTLVSGFGAGALRKAAALLPWQSPEQILGGPRAASRQSDVYLLGMVLHACLAGHNPFEGDPEPDVAILSRPPPSLEPLGVPPSLAAVARRALSVKAADRFASAADMGRAVEDAVSDLAAPAEVATWVESLFPPGMGMRLARQRAIDAAQQAARAGAAAPERPAEEVVSLEAAAVSPARAAEIEIDLVSGQFSLAAPPFPPPPPSVVGPGDIVGEGPVAPPPRPRPGASLPRASAEPPPARRAAPPRASAEVPPRAVAPAAEAAAPALPREVEFSEPPTLPGRRWPASPLAVTAVGVAGLAIGWWLSTRPAEPGVPRGATVAEPAPVPSAPAAVPVAAPPPPREAPRDQAPRASAPQAAEPPREDRARVAAPVQPQLEITTSEPGEVLVDGKLVGRPPLVRPVTAGRREVRLLNPNLGLDVSRTVEVRAPRTAVHLEVGMGRLSVRAPEGAEIVVDGRPVATGSVRGLEVFEGRHRLEVALGPARHRHEFRIGPGETYDYEVSAVAQ